MINFPVFSIINKMKIRTFIIICFAIFAIATTSGYAILTYFGALSIEDQFIGKQLEDISQQYLSQLEVKSPEQIRPLSIMTYIGTDEMPDSLFSIIGRYHTGYHNIFLAGDHHPGHKPEEIELQVSISNIPNSNKRLYIVYDVSDIEMSQSQKFALLIILIIAGGVVSGIAIVIAFFLAGKITKPIKILTKRIAESRDGKLPTDLVAGLAENEIYYLGRTLEDANKRLVKFMVREREFTRNASHELRTPLAVIKGAYEVLQVADSCPKRPLARIGRSIQEMELSTKTFLHLAREDNVGSVAEYKAEDVCCQCLENLDFLVEKKEVSLQLKVQYPLQINVPKELIYIILSNLIRNSIRYTEKGNITVIIEEDGLAVEDTGSGISADILGAITEHGVCDPDRGEYGYGLAIVEQICAQIGWSVGAENLESGGARVKLMAKLSG